MPKYMFRARPLGIAHKTTEGIISYITYEIYSWAEIKERNFLRSETGGRQEPMGKGEAETVFAWEVSGDPYRWNQTLRAEGQRMGGNRAWGLCSVRGWTAHHCMKGKFLKGNTQGRIKRKLSNREWEYASLSVPGLANKEQEKKRGGKNSLWFSNHKSWLMRTCGMNS